MQTALVRVFPHAASLDKPSSLKAYLFATVRNLWRNECRRNPLDASRVDVDLVELTPGPDEIVDSRADCDIARSAFETLAPSHREVIHLRYIDGLAYTDVARALGVTRSTARQRLHRARECLRLSFIRSDPDRD